MLYCAFQFLPFGAAITLTDKVDWRLGSEIYVSPASFDYQEGEFALVQGISSLSLILAKPMSGMHFGSASIERLNSLQVILSTTYIGL